MKRLITLITIGILFLTSIQSWAQEKGDSRLVVGLGMGTKAAINEGSDSKVFGTGLSIIGDYFIINKLAIGTSYTLFFKTSIGDPSVGEVSYESNTFNIEGKYFFVTSGVNVYALAGVAFASEKATLSSVLSEPLEFKDNLFGVTLGVGAEFSLGEKLFISTQAAYNTPLEEIIMHVGIGYTFNNGLLNK